MLERWPKLRAWKRYSREAGFRRFEPEIRIGARIELSCRWDGADYTEDDFNGSISWLDPLPSIYNEETQQHEFHYRRGFVEYGDPDNRQQQELCHQFVESIPLAILHRITRFESAQWQLIRLCTHIPELAKLIDSNPTLAYMLACAERFRSGQKPTVNRLRKMLALSEAQIAGWLGFPETQRAVQILRKILPNACNYQALLMLRELFPRWNAHWAELKIIDSLTLALLTQRSLAGLVSLDFAIEFSALNLAERIEVFEILQYAKGKELREFAAVKQFETVASLREQRFRLIALSLLLGGSEDFFMQEQRLTDYLDPAPAEVELLPAKSNTEHDLRFKARAPDQERFSIQAYWIYFENLPGFSNLGETVRNALVRWLENALEKIAVARLSLGQ